MIPRRLVSQSETQQDWPSVLFVALNPPDRRVSPRVCSHQCSVLSRLCFRAAAVREVGSGASPARVQPSCE
jgi:hypothetical protein